MTLVALTKFDKTDIQMRNTTTTTYEVLYQVFTPMPNSFIESIGIENTIYNKRNIGATNLHITLAAILIKHCRWYQQSIKIKCQLISGM